MTAMKREEELTVSVKPLTWEHDGSRYHAYCRVTDTRYVANNEGEKREREAGRAARIRSALLSAPKTKPEPVGWETDAEWELEMRCCNITEATPFAEVSKLINDLWQQYCLAAEPKPEATEGVDHQVHHSKPVVSQNTQIVEDNATEGGAHENQGFEVVPVKMTAAMINAWSGGLTVTTDEIALNTSFQDAWSRVLRAALNTKPEGGNV